MDNGTIATTLKSTALLLELHGKNPFKIKSYQYAAFKIAHTEQDLSALSLEELAQMDGIGKSIAARIHEMNETGTLQIFESLREKTPKGIVDMLKLQGIGPKKIRIIWQALGIEDTTTLLQACQNNTLAQHKGFGKKTQEAIKQSVLFQRIQQGKLHYATALPYAMQLEEVLKQAFPKVQISFTGPLRRKMAIIDTIELLIGIQQVAPVMAWLDQVAFIQKNMKTSGPLAWRGNFIDNNLACTVLFCTPNTFYQNLIRQTGAEKHLALASPNGQTLGALLAKSPPNSEQVFYAQAALPYIPPELREGLFELDWAKNNPLPQLIEPSMLQGVIHSHTTYSDGKHSLAAMAHACKQLGYHYLGITDHSQSAAYAGGLNVHAIEKQYEEIDRLNAQLAPFKIFKGIESDILANGSLDYPDEILARFDFIIASIHSGLQMDIQKATNRLLKAIQNPFTTILGHPTGRLLLRREGYPIDYKAVIDACAAHGVVIEINANPWRLDLDWRWVPYAMRKNVWLSINPDAHTQDNFDNMQYGVYVAKKGGVTQAHTFNSLSCKAIEAYFQQRKEKTLGKLQAK